METIQIENAEYLILPKNSGLKSYIEPAFEDLKLNEGVKLIERRGEDIPYILSLLYEQGTPALGITGDDLYDEARYASEKVNADLELINTTDWLDEKAVFGRPVLALLSKKEAKLNKDKIPIIGIPEKYKQTAKRWLAKYFKVKPFPSKKVVLFSGGVEENIALGLYDWAIDVIYTGESMRKAKLVLQEKIRGSDISTIANKLVKYVRM